MLIHWQQVNYGTLFWDTITNDLLYGLKNKKQTFVFKNPSWHYSFQMLSRCHSVWQSWQSGGEPVSTGHSSQRWGHFVTGCTSFCCEPEPDRITTGPKISPVSALQACTGISSLASNNSQLLVSLLSLTIRGRWLFDFELCTWPTLITHTTTCLILNNDLILLNLLQQQNSLSPSTPSPPASVWSVAMRRLTFKDILLGHHPPNPASPYRLASAEPWGEGASEVSDPVRGADTADRAAAPEANRNPALLSSSASFQKLCCVPHMRAHELNS